MNSTTKITISAITILLIASVIGWIWVNGNQEDANTTTSSTIPTPSQQDSSPPASESATEDESDQGIVKEIEITNEGMDFMPKTITVNRGDVVRIIYTSVGDVHTFTLPEFDVDTGEVADGEKATVEFIASAPGSFEFYCTPHRDTGMTGTLNVE